MSKHTKGPWEVGGPYPGVSVTFMADAGYGGPDGGAEPPRYEAICIVDGRTEGEQNPEALANARLIAAAPELLEALDYIATEGSDCPPNEDPATFYRNQLLACIGHAARAITKAESK